MNARWLDEATLIADAWFERLLTRFEMEWEGDRYGNTTGRIFQQRGDAPPAGEIPPDDRQALREPD